MSVSISRAQSASLYTSLGERSKDRAYNYDKDQVDSNSPFLQPLIRGKKSTIKQNRFVKKQSFNKNSNFSNNVSLGLQKSNTFFNDFARITPKNNHHDRDRLYGQSIQLKKTNNLLQQEITKLKTRISFMQRQKDKNLLIQRENSSNDKNNKFGGRISSAGHNAVSIFQGKQPVDGEQWLQNLKKKAEIMDKVKSNISINPTNLNLAQKVQSFKRLLHQSRDEIDRLIAQKQKLKRSAKYTKIQELQADNHQLSETLMRLKLKLQEQMNKNLNEFISAENYKYIENQLNDKLSENQQLQDQLQKMGKAIAYLQEQIKQNQAKSHEKLRMKQKEINILRKKLLQRDSELDFHKRCVAQLNEQKSKLTFYKKKLRSGEQQSDKFQFQFNSCQQLQQTNHPKQTNSQQSLAVTNKDQDLLAVNKKTNLEYKKSERPLSAKYNDKNQAKWPNYNQSSNNLNEKYSNQKNKKMDQDQQALICDDDEDYQFQQYKDEYFQQNNDVDCQNQSLPKQSKKSQKEVQPKQHHQKNIQKKPVQSLQESRYKQDNLQQLALLLRYRAEALSYTPQQIIELINQENSKSASKKQNKLTIDSVSVLLAKEPFHISNQHQIKKLLEHLFDAQILYKNLLIKCSDLKLKLIDLLGGHWQVPNKQEQNILIFGIANKVQGEKDFLQNLFQTKKLKFTYKDLHNLLISRGFTQSQTSYIIKQISLYSDSVNQLNCQAILQRFDLSRQSQQGERQQEVESIPQEESQAHFD